MLSGERIQFLRVVGDKIRTDAHLRERFTLDLRDFPIHTYGITLNYLLFSSFFDYDALKLIRERVCVACIC